MSFAGITATMTQFVKFSLNFVGNSLDRLDWDETEFSSYKKAPIFV